MNTRPLPLTFVLLAFPAVLLGSVTACDEDEREPTQETRPPEPAPEPLEALPESIDVNAQKVLLGRRLFHDTKLSGDETVACVTCHSLDHGGAEPRPTSVGIRGQVGPINAPTVLNAGLAFRQFWDGRAADLNEQAAGPVTNAKEMGATWEQVLERLKADADYVRGLGAIYEDGITQANVTDAIAEYEKSLITPSRFDRFLRGQQGAITEAEREGYETFKSVGCTSCHLGVLVGGTMYQKMGLVQDYFTARGNLTEADNGRFNVTQSESDRHFFKVPTLRNVEHTAPYFHDGSRQDLGDAVRVMAQVQLGRELTAEQVAQIVAFLHSLSGELPAHARPGSPRPLETPTNDRPGESPASAQGTPPAQGTP